MKRARLWAALGLAAVCAWHLALRWQGLRLPLMEDEGEYAYAAQIWSAGGLPYRDAYLQKPPTIVLLYRAAYAVSDRPQAPRYLALLCTWAALVFLFLATPRSWPLAARLAPAGVLAAASALPLGDFGFAANTEIFVCFFSAAGYYFLTRAESGPRRALWIFLTGAALGAAVSTKQTAGLTLIGFAALAAWRGGKRFDARALGWCALGAAVVPALWAAYFGARGGFGALLDQTWTRNRLYASVISSPALILMQAGWFFRAVLPGLAGPLAPALLAAGYGLSGVEFSYARRREAAAAVWLAATLGSAATGLFLFPHYFLAAAAPLAALCGFGVERLGRRRSRLAAVCLAAVLTLFPAAAKASLYFGGPPSRLARRLLYPNPLNESLDLAREIAAKTAPDDPVYVYGSEPQIYFYAHRRCATAHAVVYALTLFPRDEADGRDELAKLRAARPKVVVYSAQPMSGIIGSALGFEFRGEIRRWLAADYRWTGRVDVLPDRSRENFDAASFAGRTPDWGAEDSLFLFERRAR